MDHNSAVSTIAVELNSDSFALPDSKEINERLGTQLQVESYMFSDVIVEGGLPSPDVILQIIASSLPLADIYVNLVSSALYDVLMTARLRQGKRGSKGIFAITARNEDGQITHSARVETDDPKLIEQLMREANEAATQPSEDD